VNNTGCLIKAKQNYQAQSPIMTLGQEMK